MLGSEAISIGQIETIELEFESSRNIIMDWELDWEFWGGLPSLVKDGVAFTLRGLSLTYDDLTADKSPAEVGRWVYNHNHPVSGALAAETHNPQR
jgi:hypothetical protein